MNFTENLVYHGSEVLLLVSLLFLLAIPKSLLILKESLYTSCIISGLYGNSCVLAIMKLYTVQYTHYKYLYVKNNERDA